MLLYKNFHNRIIMKPYLRKFGSEPIVIVHYVRNKAAQSLRINEFDMISIVTPFKYYRERTLARYFVFKIMVLKCIFHVLFSKNLQV